ncbi:MAG: SDR family oxidoreductase [Moraxellaceae bacterium]|nr:SDR family oxidoreductase [Moraxellaceae bacterium]
MNEKPYILVTGAGGALAQAVINRLHDRYRIVACDSRREVTLPPDIPSYHLDVQKRDFEDLFREYHFEGVIHLGRLGANEGARERRYNANVTGTQKLLELCVKYHVGQVLVLSTYFVYGAHPLNPAYLTESAPLKASGITMDLVDSVELENLAMIYFWKHPELKVTLLRPCNIVGPGVNNSISQLLMKERVPVLMGFSPMMQFIHLDDMAEAITLAFGKNIPGIYNVAPDDVVAYQHAVTLCGCRKQHIPSIPPQLPVILSRVLGWKHFPPYLMDYFKYSATINGRQFRETFGFTPRYSLSDIFRHYALLKK